MNIDTNHTNINFKSYKSIYLADRNAAKKEILRSKNISQAADTFEKFADEIKSKHLDDLNKITQIIQKSAICGMTLLTGIGLLTDIPAITLIGSLIGFSSYLFSKKVLFPIIEKNSTNIYRDLFDIYSDVFAEENEDECNIAKNSSLKAHYKKHKKEDQENLYNWILNYYTETPKEDKVKFFNFIKNNYDEYYWNDLIVYCLRFSDNIHDRSNKANFTNFLKLKEMSEAVYDMWHNSYIAVLGRDIHRNNKQLREEFDKNFPDKHFCDYLYNNWRKDKNGIITDEEVENFKKFAKLGPHQAFEFLELCHNRDGYLAWDSANIFEYASVLIEHTLYIDKYPEEKQKSIQYMILNSLIEASYNNNGIIDKNKLEELYNKIKNEIKEFGIKRSKTLKAISDTYVRTELGMFDDEIETVNDAINKPNRLFNLLDNKTSITSFLKDIKCTPSEVFGLLYKLTSTKEGKKRIVREFSSNPRIGQDIKDLLLDKLGGNKKAEKYFNTWYYDEKYGYRHAYKDYYKYELYDKATDLMTLVKQSPNIGTWAFRQKAAELGVKPTLGSIPNDFGSEADFHDILQKLAALNKEQSKQNDLERENEKIIHELNINGKKYYAQKINKGHSAKLKYIINRDGENAKKYVLKFSPYDVMGNTDRSRKFNDSFMLRGDSPYLVALVDFYLKENFCKNAPDIKYFDYNEKAVLYEMTIGKELQIDDMDFFNAYMLNNSEKLSDIKSLGVLINDINYKNIVEKEDGTLVIVDTGHAGFLHPFRPMVQGINITLSNLCGRELI